MESATEVSVQAPFTATHRGVSAYRTFALVLDEPAPGGTVEHASDGDVTASTVRVAAAGSVLAVDSSSSVKGIQGRRGRGCEDGG